MKLHRKFVEGVKQVKNAAELYQYLQNAIELEHCTIPPYLTAMFSLKPGINDDIARLIHEIIVQEMLHMTIACNIMIAIGGHPKINTKRFIPPYPGNLPMDIGGADFIVGIEAFSKSLVKNIFMAIEEPENIVPPGANLYAAQQDEYATIGAFYDAIKNKIRALPQDIFKPGCIKNQVLGWFPSEQLFAITDADTACAAIDVIITQGEGTSTNPFEGSGDGKTFDPAHYYKFEEIYEGRKIIPLPAPYSYGGAPIPFDPAGVYPIRANCKIGDFAVGSQASTRINQFAYTYSSMLNALHKTFNGHPAYIDTAIGLMYSLKMEAVALMQTYDPNGGGLTVGPSFEYTNVQGGMD
ncbi:rubrerythrin [Oxalobacteraceae bacterium GrIS 1.11]